MKPRIWRIGVRWICYDLRVAGTGRSPKQAYDEWVDALMFASEMGLL